MMEKLLSLLLGRQGMRGLVYLSTLISVFSPTIVVAYLVSPQDFGRSDLAHMLLIAAAAGGASLLIAAVIYFLLEIARALMSAGGMLRAGRKPDALEKKSNSQNGMAATALTLSGFGSLILQSYVACKVVALHLGISSFIAGIFVSWWQMAPYLGVTIALMLLMGFASFALGQRAARTLGQPVESSK